MATQIQVLYVNDDPDSLQTWTDFLTAYEEVAVTTATSQSAALDIIADTAVDCLLSDLTTDDDGNLELLRALSEDEIEIPFILFVDDEHDETINAVIDAGADDYVPKSLAENVLLRRLEQHAPEATGQETDDAGLEATRDAAQTSSADHTTNADAGGVTPDATDHETADTAGDDPVDITDHSSAVETASATTEGAASTEPDDVGPISTVPEMGSSTLLTCPREIKGRRASPVDVLAAGQHETSNVVLVRYTQPSTDILEELCQRVDRVTVVAIGYAQSLPADLEDVVDVVAINSPSDLTRLGIVVTGIVESWETETMLYFDTLNIVANYKSAKQIFQFLHILTAKLDAAAVTSYFHVDPSTMEAADINSLKPIFDAVLTVSSDGTDLQRLTG